MSATRRRKVGLGPLPEAFNLIGRAQFGDAWSGREAAAIRLGQGPTEGQGDYERGKTVQRTMKECADDGRLGLVYTDHKSNRVRYLDHPGPWIAAIHPDPTGSQQGMVELSNHEIHDCWVELRDAKSLARELSASRRRPGPKVKFTLFVELCDEFFKNHSIEASPSDVCDFIRREIADDTQWPRKTRRNDLIEIVRDRVRQSRRPEK